MPIEVKKVDYQDPDQSTAVLMLLNHYSMDPMGASAPLPDDVQENLIAQMQRRTYFGSAIAYVDTVPAGLVNYAEGLSTFAAKPLMNVHDLVVHRDYRGKGLSQELLAFVENEARALGCCKVTLEVLGGNEIAQNAYRKFGFAAYRLSEDTGVAEFWQKKLE